MLHIRLLFCVVSAVLLFSCSSTTSTNNPVTPPQSTTATINFVATVNDTAVDALWWIKVMTPPVLGSAQGVYVMTGEKHSAFHYTLDFSQQFNGDNPTGEIQYCAELSGGAQHFNSVTVSKGDLKTVVVPLTR